MNINSPSSHRSQEPESGVLYLVGTPIGNLSDISKAQLDDLQQTAKEKKHSDIISFYVPNPWKQVTLPLLSANPIEINDPNAKYLRIDFIRNELFKLEYPIPISLFFPPSKPGNLSPQKTSLMTNQSVESKEGLTKNEVTSLTSGGANGFICRDNPAGSYNSTSKLIPRLDIVRSSPSVDANAGLIPLIIDFRIRKGSARTILSCKTIPAGTNTSHLCDSADSERHEK